MVVPLLSTKLFIPQPRPNLVRRPRLNERLNQKITSHLILISAPAGFGKSTLLCDWIKDVEYPVAWVSLDDSDNDLVRFFSYFITAIRNIFPEVGENALTALLSLQNTTIEEVLISLINDIVLQNTAMIMILDDYHVIESTEIDKALTFLLDHLPPKMCLVIATRVTPSLPLSRFRAGNQMTEIRADDLRFTPTEITDFFQEIINRELEMTEVLALESHTEGWIVGLQLAAISIRQLKENAQVASFIKNFTGSHRYILDYLTDEVLQQCSPESLDFLLKTSILGRMCGSLCDAITGKNDGGDQLITLDEANMFLVPLDNQRNWFRYHHLFSDLLQQRLRTSQPKVIAELHEKASVWYEKHHYINEALDHAIKANRFDRAAWLVAENAQNFLVRGEVKTIADWFSVLPAELILANPRLCIDQAWLYYFTHQPEEIEPFLLKAQDELSRSEQLSPEKVFKWEGEVMALRAWAKRCCGEYAASIKLSEKALERLSEDEMFVRCLNILSMADALCAVGETSKAAQAIEDCVCSCKKAGSPLGVVAGAYDLAVLLMRQGYLEQAKKTLVQALHWAEEQGVNQLPGIAPLHIGLGDILREQNQIIDAERHLRMGLKLAELGYHTILGNGYLSLAHLKYTVGDISAAQETLQLAETATQNWDTSEIIALLSSHRVHLWLDPIHGDPEAAYRWAKEYYQNTKGQKTNVETDLSIIIDLLTIARINLHQLRKNNGSVHQSLDHLEKLQHILKTNKLWGYLIESQVLESLVYQTNQQTNKAVEVIEEALGSGLERGYFRVFIDEGPAMKNLLYEAVQRGTHNQYASTLLTSMDSNEVEQHEQPETQRSGLIQPLSKREVEVLYHIADGKTNQEVSQALVLSLNTVKGHTRKIYQKLSVNNRTQAVAKARSLGIL